MIVGVVASATLSPDSVGMTAFAEAIGSNPVRSRSMFAKRLSSSIGLAVAIIFEKGSGGSEKALISPFVAEMDAGSEIPARVDEVMGILLCNV